MELKNKNGFTLIETVITIALIAGIFTILGNVVYQTTTMMLDAKKYTDATDSLYDDIQSDSQYKNNLYCLKVTKDGSTDSTTIPIRAKESQMKANNRSDDILELNSFNTSLGYYFKFGYIYSIWIDKNDVPNQPKLSEKKKVDVDKIPQLDGWGVTKFSDLPNLKNIDDTNSKELQTINNDFGKWAFVGWSTEVDDDIKTPCKRQTFTLGNTDIASNSNGWKGLLTENNFNDYLSYVKSKYPTPDSTSASVQLYATYIYSRDLYDDHGLDDTYLKNRIGNSTTQTVDMRTLQELADSAANLIKMSSMSDIQTQFGGSGSKYYQALTSESGIEVLHFRENGWPVVAENPYRSLVSTLETKTYSTTTKIGDQNNYYGGTKKGQFLYNVFQGIGYDFTKIGNQYWYDWLGVDYDYSCLMFSSDFDDKNDKSHPYSLFMRLNENTNTVSFWIAKFDGNGKPSLYGSYIANATYR